jgi:hypothetical protein
MRIICISVLIRIGPAAVTVLYLTNTPVDYHTMSAAGVVLRPCHSRTLA